MMLGVPEPEVELDDPAVPEFVPLLLLLPLLLLPLLPLLPLLLPTVPVVCGIPAFPTPVPKLGVTVVLPGPGPPGTPTPEGFPGCPAAAPPGEVAPTLPLDVPVPPAAPPVPPAAATRDQRRVPFQKSSMVRSRGLEPPRVAPLAPQASASTNSATTASEEECRTSRRLATRV